MSRFIRESKMGYAYTKEAEDLLPWSMQVELHEGCNRSCWFCGIVVHHKTGQKERALPNNGHDISPDLLRKVFKELNDWMIRLRIEINSHGEPTLHPKWFDCLKIMSEEFLGASLIAQTNCKGWIDGDPEDFIKESYYSGLDELILNCYDLEHYDFFKKKLAEWGIPFIDYYYDNPDKVSGNSYYKKNSDIGRTILWKDLGSMNVSGEVRKFKKINKRLTNSAGNGNIDLITKFTGNQPVPLPKPNRCSKVHREIILGWNGIIPVCCQDWRDQFVMGDCNKNDVRDIWYSPRWYVLRQLLYRRRRDLFVPCYYCDDPTTRTGLDKDPGFELNDEELLEVIEYTQEKDWGLLPIVSEYQKLGNKISPFYSEGEG